MGRPPLPPAHGTNRGYRRHLYDRTPPCTPCKRAEAWRCRLKRLRRLHR